MKPRYEGALLGLAAGDALGTTVEFQAPGTFPPVSDIVGGGPFNLKRGAWTDDTSLALCLAESLIECRAFDAADQMERYIRWWRDGHLSSTGFCFDIGGTTSYALQTYIRTEDPFSGSTSPRAAGNGSLMRLAPAPLFFAADPALAVRMSAESSRTTHGAATCLDACRYYGGLIAGAVSGAPKEALLAPRYAPVPGLWEREPLCAEIDEVAAGSFLRKEPPAIVGSGYVVQSLEAALWAFSRSTNFQDGCLLAVNLGYDADTTAAIYRQLAGAHYGVESIPERWRGCLAQAERIREFADQLYERRYVP
jgi:ADP-ribosylglycohydrolase